MENVSICCVGDSTVDRFFQLDNSEAELLCKHNDCEIAFKYGDKILIESYHKSFGGSALNTSIGFSRLSIVPSIATIIGEDTDGKDIKSFLASNSVITDQVIEEGETNQSAILIYKHERTIFSFHKDREYSDLILPKTNWLYLSSAGDGFEGIIPKIMELVGSGVKLAINPGSAELKNFEKLSGLLEKTEMLFLNKQEAEMLFEEQDIKPLLKKIISGGVKKAVITDGSNGAYIANDKEMFHMGIAPSTLVDPTGAGDSFACGFTAGIINDLSLEESAKWGMVNSASVIGKIGANEGLLLKEEIIRRVQEATVLSANKI